MTSSYLIEQLIAAFVGTVAFALLFGVPRKYYLMCGMVSTLGWLLYLVLMHVGLTGAESTFPATVLVLLLSRAAAVRKSCPVTVFLTTGIFPLIPGAGIYWTVYYLIMDDTAQASSTGFEAIKAALAIVLGIVLVMELPSSMFRIFSKGDPQDSR